MFVKALSLVNDENYIEKGQEDTGDMAGDLDELKTVVPSLCTAVSEQLEKLDDSEKKIEQLTAEIAHFQTVTAELKARHEDEKVVGDELCSQLQEARSQAEYSTAKVSKLLRALDEARSAASVEQRQKCFLEAARQEAKLQYENQLDLSSEEREELEIKFLEAESTLMDLSSRFVRSEREL